MRLLQLVWLHLRQTLKQSLSIRKTSHLRQHRQRQWHLHPLLKWSPNC
jgi:hypothetical protein